MNLPPAMSRLVSNTINRKLLAKLRSVLKKIFE